MGVFLAAGVEAAEAGVEGLANGGGFYFLSLIFNWYIPL